MKIALLSLFLGLTIALMVGWVWLAEYRGTRDDDPGA
jgi:hypothetical protein